VARQAPSDQRRRNFLRLGAAPAVSSLLSSMRVMLGFWARAGRKKILLSGRRMTHCEKASPRVAWRPDFTRAGSLASSDAVDRFFGDALHLGQRAFGLRTPAPLWTAASLNRCLLLALIYPIATIFIFWAISGHVGPAENALHLHSRLGAWQRWLATAVFGISVFALSRAVRETRWKRLISILVCIITFVLAVAVSVAPLGAMVVGDAHAALHTTKVNLVQAPTFPIVPVIVAFVGSVSIAAMIVVVSAVLGALRRLNP
jgi:hypothetical protein